MLTRLFLLLLIVFPGSIFFLNTECCAEDWTQFRGSLNNGIVTGPDLPDSFDHIDWKIDLQGRGVSAPIIVGDRLFLTSSKGFNQDRLIVSCYQVKNGDKPWQREFWAAGRTVCHNKMAVATPTPASDGKRIFAYYSSNDVVCLDLEGNLQWFRGLTFDYPNVSNSLGMASSLVVKQGTVVCMAENDTHSLSFGLNTIDGTTRWKLDRPRKANWTSPVVWPGDEPLVLLQSSKGVSAVDVTTGKVKWEYLDGAATSASLTIQNEIAYVPSHGITAIRPGISDPNTPNIVWQSSQLSPATASPIAYKDRVYVINRAGVVSCAQLSDGERVWQARMKGPFSATPIISAGRLYAINEKGLAQILELKEESGEVISSHDFKDTFLATPSASNGAIYLRSDQHLWKISSSEK